MDISTKINMLDDIFSSYLLNKNDREFCRDASSFLSTVSSKTISVSIVDNQKMSKEPFFGMRVFSHPDEVDDVLEKLLSDDDNTRSLSGMIKLWETIRSWELEIDSRVFDRMAINFNPQELTAMTLHEIGHTIYSDKKVEQYYRAYQACRFKMSSVDKASAKILFFLYQVPLILVCGMRNWKLSDRDLREEVFADNSVQKLGYGEHLVSAYQKIIKAYGSSVYHDPNRIDAEVGGSIQWCTINAHDLVRRKNKLRDELYATGASTNSLFIRKTIRSIMDKLAITTRNRYSGNVVLESALSFDFFANESFVTEYELIYDVKKFGMLENRINAAKDIARKEIAQEAFGFKKNRKSVKVPSQLDVDTIFVEIDRMQNHADRRYVLDLIYYQEEKINRFIELFEYDESLERKYAGKMESMLKELASMRKSVLDKRSFDKNYKVFVKYPEGYEG